MDTAKRIGAWVATVALVWPVQYLIYVPAVVLWRATKLVVGFALRLGAIGVLLLFLPVIGWLILGAWLLFRRPDYGRRLVELEERRQGIEHRSVLSPWRPFGVPA